jgi:DNA-directed RNA polymerase subunit RPC12/RpoP
MTQCPRCASDTDGSRFCWMCNWDMDTLYIECPRCGSDVGNDGYCMACGALVFIEEDDDFQKEP